MESGRSTPAAWEGLEESPSPSPEPGTGGVGGGAGEDPLQLARVAAINSEKRPLVSVKSIDTVTQPGVTEVSGRSGHCAFDISEEDPRIFVHGGANKAAHFGDMYVFNTKLKRWSRCPLFSAPRGRAYQKTMFIRPDKSRRGKRAVPRVLSYGGIMQSKAADPEVHLLPEWGILLKGPAGANDSVPQPKGSSEVGQAKPGQRTDAWRVKAVDGDVPLARSNHAASVIGGKHVVVLGGWHGDFVSDVYVLDTETWLWALKETRLSPEAMLFGGIAPRAGHTVTVLSGRRLLVFGGQNNLGQLGDLWLLDTKNWVWHRPQVAGENPRKRSGHSAVYDKNNERVIFFGGWDGSQELDDVLILNVKGDVRYEWYWQKGKLDAQNSAIFTKNYGRVGHSATMKGEEMWVFGGHSQGIFLNDVMLMKVSVRADDDTEEDEVTGAALGFVTEVLGRSQWQPKSVDDVLEGLDQKMKLAKEAMQHRTGVAKRVAHEAEFKRRLEEADRQRNLMATEAYQKEQRLQGIIRDQGLTRSEAQDLLNGEKERRGSAAPRGPVAQPSDPRLLAAAPERPASSASQASPMVQDLTADFYARNQDQTDLALEAIAATGGLSLHGEPAFSVSSSRQGAKTTASSCREPFRSAGKTLQKARAEQDERKALRDRATTVQPPKRRGFRPKRRTPTLLEAGREGGATPSQTSTEEEETLKEPQSLQVIPSPIQDNMSVSTVSAYLPLRHQQGHVPEQIEAIVIRTQAHVRGWLARRRILKARAVLRLQAFARGWKQRRQARIEA